MNSTSTNNSFPLASRPPNPFVDPKSLLYFTVFLLLTNAFGTVANILLLLAIAIHRPLRKTVSHILIAHCLVLDLASTIVSVPASVVQVYLPPHLPAYFCRYEGLLVYGVNMAISWATTVIALQRLAAALLHRHFKTFMTTRGFLRAMLLFPWLVTAILVVFTTTETGLKIARLGAGNCVIVSASNSSTPVFVYTVFSRYLPTVLDGVSYLVVLTKTCGDLRRRPGSHSLQRRLELSRMLFLSFLWRCCTVYPSTVAISFFPAEYARNFAAQMATAFLWFSFGAIDPIFFWASSRLFQRGVKEVLSHGKRYFCCGAPDNRRIVPAPASHYTTRHIT
ncbi:hypothetical protein BV898_06441 [Hypsibius exemplaris]|uniref:G-protein coupled receptors family 1 profile domain-containing protein n=1 Tax=Hypsibius exemplaris TaxID=2072580 RepID=A0A1W0WW78_HYPEX|nr:hypothetical protein BV898_06441 [Hypsibius exemplaris]